MNLQRLEMHTPTDFRYDSNINLDANYAAVRIKHKIGKLRIRQSNVT